MSGSATEPGSSPPALSLPADIVLNSGAVIFPGTFDQQGCPLVLFPAEEQNKLTSDLNKEEVVGFINYFLQLHNKYQAKESLVSVVVDLRKATLITARFVAETLLLLELHKRTVHTLYVVQSQKKDVLKLFLKILMPSNIKNGNPAPFKHIFLKEVFELCNYIDRSQLTADLGGYFVYCHQSWVAFLKDIDGFLQEFLSVVHRLPACIAALQKLYQQPVPNSLEKLENFCSVNEARFQQLRRELGLDELLRHCECVVEKLRHPENEPCYQAMAGTALFTQTAYDMLQNYSRIISAVEKLELLWQRAFSKAHLQLQVLQLQSEAQQIIELINNMHQEKLQPYRIEIAKDAQKAEILRLDFKASVYTPAMVKFKFFFFHRAVELPHQTLRAVSDFCYYYNKSRSWYSIVLRENLFQDLLWRSHYNSIPKLCYPQELRDGATLPWKKVFDFLKRNPSPDMEELLQLAHLANIIPDPHLQQNGRLLSHRCMTLRKLLTSPDAAALHDLQLALQWQYDFLRGNQRDFLCAEPSSTKSKNERNCTDCSCSPLTETKSSRTVSDVHSGQMTANCGPLSNLDKWNFEKEMENLRHQILPLMVSGTAPTSAKPPSLSSFDSGFEGAGSIHLDPGSGRDGICTRENFRPAMKQPRINEENVGSVSDSEDCREGLECHSVENNSKASIKIIPNIAVNALNFEIKVKRSATLPKNPWLSLPVEDLENSYTVTITPKGQNSQHDFNSPGQSQRIDHMDGNPSKALLPHTEMQTSTQKLSTREELPAPCIPGGTYTKESILQAQDSFEDSEMSPIHNVLSSTIKDTQENCNFTTDSVHTLLWDTYDLYNRKQDDCDRLVNSLSKVSLSNWDVKEHEGLMEVEKTLDRTAEILEAKESVLAQQEMLDVLLKTETTSKQWALWETKDELHTLTMSSSDLLEAGADTEDHCSLVHNDEHTSGCPKTTCLPHDVSEQMLNGASERPFKTSLLGKQSGKCDLLQELRGLHHLEEQILEENIKIHELRQSEELEMLAEKKADPGAVQSSNKEWQVFQQQLEKEKREVEKMEKCLMKELAKDHKKKLTRGRKVVKCSIMERTSKQKQFEDNTLCEELMLSCKKRQCDKQQLNTSQQSCNDLTADSYTMSSSFSEQHYANQTEMSEAKLFRTEASVSNDDNGSFPYEKVGVCSSLNKCACVPNLPCSNDKVVDGAPGLISEASQTLSPEREAFDPGGMNKPPVPKPRRAKCERTLANFTEPLNEALFHRGNQDNVPVKQGLGVPPKPKERKNKQTIVSSGMKPQLETSDNDKPLVGESVVHEAAALHTDVPKEQGKGSEDLETMLAINSALISVEKGLRSEVPKQAQGEMKLTLKAELVSEETLGQVEEVHHENGPFCLSESSKTVVGSACRSPVSDLNINIREMSEFGTPIVLDTGSGLMKAGFADQDLPTTVFPTVIGFPKYDEVMNGYPERETYIGHEAQHMRGVLALRHPMKHGIIHNWDEMEKVWHHTFQQLRVEPENHPVLLTEAAMNPQENRERMVELMFEAFAVPFTYVAMQAVLALYAAGRTTGVVFDSGDGVSHSVPVFEGYCLPHAVQRFALAGADVTLQLRKLLQEQGVAMRTSAELEIVREMKEQCCCVAQDYEAELSRGGLSSREVSYTMPDGHIVRLSAERFRAPEILFRPELIGRDHYGLHESIFKSVLYSDIDLRKTLVGNIVLSGGNTLLAGLPQRLQSEIRNMAPMNLADCVRVTSPKDRDFSVWSGGGVLARLPSFALAWISQEEYEEFGPQIVFRKCF
ncbi:uncharacterized protein LOC108929278 isoform X1 [Arapaima gigas]